MRWLFVKDLQILKRSPLLVGLLVVYPIAIALMIGFAISSPPGKPTVAILDEVPPGKGTINFGSQQINISTLRQVSCSSRSSRCGSTPATRRSRRCARGPPRPR